ncbi:hypothetical protein [Nonomuraea sp. SYSU D8015]|uniref:hypothetical protein n=1 Tax=Nonomuraea sp. SYSU D8015 TaxID=2593644 RepID=UPI0016609117|nr:hypothetical protein [Nonomuraea sp. SYSU D8015]
MIPFGYVPDDTVLIELGRRDMALHRLIISFDRAHVRTSVPFITLAAAEAVLSPDQRLVVRGVIDVLEHVHVDPVAAHTEAARLAEVVARMEQPADMAAAHVVAVSQHLDWPVLTADAGRWDTIKAHLPWQVELVEISDLD